MSIKPGDEEGYICGRRACKGLLEYRLVEGCSCHINPPCWACTTPSLWCPECGWREEDDITINDYVANLDRETGVYRTWVPRPLDITKIDYRTKSHTHFSQICEGVYPEGTSQGEVEKIVRGSFGGRFIQFGGGQFTYVAYTD